MILLEITKTKFSSELLWSRPAVASSSKPRNEHSALMTDCAGDLELLRTAAADPTQHGSDYAREDYLISCCFFFAWLAGAYV